MKRIILVSLAILIGCLPFRINAATTEEYETQIKALASALNCMEENLATLVGEEQARQLKAACINPIPTNVVSGLVVTAPAQPPATLAPLGAARIPFTKVTFTASADGDVTVDGLVVERTGLSVDAVLDSIMLLDEGGMLIGSQGYLNANHQTTLTAPFTVKAGQSRTLTIAANRTSWGTAAHAGMVVSLSVVRINISATVNGSLPITGASHVINEGLVIGSVVVMRGSTDPGMSTLQYVGTDNYTFSAIRIIAGSAENVSPKAIRWYQSGSATTSDLSNIKTYIDGVGYPTLISADGKYYTSVFGDSILIERGFSKEIAIRGGIVNGAARSIDFDIETRNDLYLVGQLYEFDIIPPFAASLAPPDGSAFSVTDNPYYDASQVIVNWGDITVSSSALVAPQNIAINMQRQMLGGFTVTVRGEPILVRRIGFNVALENEGATTDVDDITNIILVDENDAIVAGPVDGMAVDSMHTAGSADGSVIFTDTVTFPIGTHSYFIKGRVRTDVRIGTSVVFSTTPGTDFALARGLTTGHGTYPTPTSSITLQTMKAVGGSLTVGIPLIPENAARTAIAGAKQTIGLTLRLYATASSEDVRTTTLPILLQAGNGANATDITNVRLYEGTTAGTTGTNVRNPMWDGIQLFTLDGNGFITPAGGVKELTLRFDVKSEAAGTIQWSVPSNLWEAGMNSVGLSTANAIPSTRVGDGIGPIITIIPHGLAAVSVDSGSPKEILSGVSEVTALKLNIEAAEENFGIRELIVESHIERNGAWAPLADYLAAFVGQGFRQETFAFPYPDFDSVIAGRIILFRSSWNELLSVDTKNSFPLELRVDTTGFPVGSKIRFRVVKLTGSGFDSGETYSASVGGVATEVLVVGIGARIQSFTVVGFPEGGVKFGTLRALGAPQEKYILEASPDLKNWERKPWFPATADSNGNILFEFEVLPQPLEFFRVVSVP